jgi:spore coat polysaccharide biosynthesis protein SpsF
MRIGIVLQARMGSERLPGKTLQLILGRPLIHYVIARLKCIALADMCVLAVPDTADNEVLRDVAREMAIEFFTGSESDVLDRFYRAAEFFDLDHIYRATGDNPLVEPRRQEELIRYHLAGGYDYTEDFLRLPHGLGGEVFSREGLARCWALSKSTHQREGVNDYILENRAEFHTGCPPGDPYPAAAMELEWTVDTPRQFAWMRAVYEALYQDGQTIEVAEVLDFIAQEGQSPCRAQ